MSKQTLPYIVYSWDGWQRGKMGAFEWLESAKELAKQESLQSIHGDEYYVIYNDEIVVSFCNGVEVALEGNTRRGGSS